jgi:hypothetical protein
MTGKLNFFSALIMIPMLLMSGCAGLSKSSRVSIKEMSDVYELNVPSNKLVLTIPKGEFVRNESNMGGSTTSPRYFYFEDNTTSIVISGWFEDEKKFPGVEKYWENNKNAWMNGGLLSPQNVSFDKIGNWDVIFYELQVSRFTSYYIMAHWVQAGTWIDLHISITPYTPSAESKSKIIELLKAITVKEKEIAGSDQVKK